MNAQNLTQKSLEAIQTAQSMALENRNNYITPEHLLYALVDQDGGLIPSLLGKMGVDCNAVLAELDTAISALPKVGSTSDAYLSPETNRILTAAEKAAKSMGDEYLSVEHLTSLFLTFSKLLDISYKPYYQTQKHQLYKKIASYISFV